MATPIAPTPKLRGADAVRFLREQERIDNLDPDSLEAKKREAFFEECIRIARKFKPAD